MLVFWTTVFDLFWLLSCSWKYSCFWHLVCQSYLPLLIFSDLLHPPFLNNWLIISLPRVLSWPCYAWLFSLDPSVVIINFLTYLAWSGNVHYSQHRSLMDLGVDMATTVKMLSVRVLIIFYFWIDYPISDCHQCHMSRERAYQSSLSKTS